MTVDRPDRVDHHRVVIVGAGFSGLGVAVKLRRRGITDIVIIEAADRPGGTWRDNTYPGCQCDIPSNLYSLSFSPNPSWTTTYPRQPEIQNYIERVVDEFDLEDVIHYGTELTQARWDGDAARWSIETSRGLVTADAVIMAIGFLSEPSIPDLPGIAAFDGPMFHSARWNQDVPLDGRRVAVIGTGASAVQLIPEIAPLVDRLAVYQRTPSWVIPHLNRLVPAPERWLYRRVPPIQRLRRAVALLVAEGRHGILTKTGPLNQLARALATANIWVGTRNRSLARLVTPDYELGCKRVLLSNHYYPALTRDNVEVVAGGATALTRSGVVGADNIERPADLVIFATGFRITGRSVFDRVLGDRGQTLNEGYADHGAYLGSTASGFPNLFCLGGPTSGVGHNSFLFMLECQQDYAVDALAAMADQDLVSVEVRHQVQADYFSRIQADTGRRVWSSGCTSWFLDDRGRNVAVYPGYSIGFRRRTRRFDPENYHVARNADPLDRRARERTPGGQRHQLSTRSPHGL